MIHKIWLFNKESKIIKAAIYLKNAADKDNAEAMYLYGKMQQIENILIISIELPIYIAFFKYLLHSCKFFWIPLH